jgi:hypothetical protein
MINVKSSDIQDLLQKDPSNTNTFTTWDKDTVQKIYTFSASYKSGFWNALSA